MVIISFCFISVKNAGCNQKEGKIPQGAGRGS